MARYDRDLEGCDFKLAGEGSRFAQAAAGARLRDSDKSLLSRWLPCFVRPLICTLVDASLVRSASNEVHLSLAYEWNDMIAQVEPLILPAVITQYLASS